MNLMVNYEMKIIILDEIFYHTLILHAIYIPDKELINTPRFLTPFTLIYRNVYMCKYIMLTSVYSYVVSLYVHNVQFPCKLYYVCRGPECLVVELMLTITSNGTQSFASRANSVNVRSNLVSLFWWFRTCVVYVNVKSTCKWKAIMYFECDFLFNLRLQVWG